MLALTYASSGHMHTCPLPLPPLPDMVDVVSTFVP